MRILLYARLSNEWYAKDTSKKIRIVKRSKGMVGEHIGSHPPYGYMKNPENKKEWIVDEEAAEVVREIFRLCVSGYGSTQIARILAEQEIFCLAYYALEKGGKPRTVLPVDKFAWNALAVAAILERTDYLGHTVNFKMHNKSYKCHKKIKHTPDEWKVFEGTHARQQHLLFCGEKYIKQHFRIQSSLEHHPLFADSSVFRLIHQIQSRLSKNIHVQR